MIKRTGKIDAGLAVLLLAGMVLGCSKPFAADEPKQPFYGQRIVTDSGTNNPATPVAIEFSRWLKQMTGAEFVATNAAVDSGIFLVHTNSALAVAADVERLRDKGTEAFLLRSEGESKLWIVGNSDMALRQGIYHYLDQLGCRWFLPNDHWTIIPQRSSINVTADRVEAPAFRVRGFFGTGGYGGALPCDPTMQLQARWEAWKNRNWFGGDFNVSGHAGEQFNLTHKAELIAHPEYLAEADGKRQPWSLGTKPCVSNPGLVKMYVEDRLALMKRGVTCVSVEPADGLGYCTCEGCRKLGLSGQVFFLANSVAKAAAEKYPGYRVSLFAYGDHAAVPDVKLEPNIFVLAIPYGFQRTGLTGDELLEEWGKKTKELGLYDYWAIPDWANCLPSPYSYAYAPERIRFWHDHGVQAFTGESSYCAGNVGLTWYVASRLLWDPKTDEKALVADFYEKSFGVAAPPMRRMFERWNSGFTLTDQELALSFRDLQAARLLAKDDAVRARIDDFGLYVEFIRHWYAYKGHAADHAVATRELLTYMWRAYDSAMVHACRLHTLITLRYEHGPKELLDAWPMKAGKTASWTNLPPITSEEIAGFIAKGVETFKPLEYETRSYSTKLVPLGTGEQSGTNWLTTTLLIGGHTFAFWTTPDMKSVEFQFRCGPRKTSSEAPSDTLTFTDPAGKIIAKEKVESDGAWHTVRVPITSAGVHQLSVFDQKLTFSMQVPATLPFVSLNGFASPGPSAPMFFYVPKGLRQLVLYGEPAAPFEMFDGAGHRVGDKLSGGFIVRDVPPGQDGKVWYVRGFKGYTPIRALNFPTMFAFTPAGMMVPEDVKL